MGRLRWWDVCNQKANNAGSAFVPGSAILRGCPGNLHFCLTVCTLVCDPPAIFPSWVRFPAAPFSVDALETNFASRYEHWSVIHLNCGVVCLRQNGDDKIMPIFLIRKKLAFFIFGISVACSWLVCWFPPSFCLLFSLRFLVPKRPGFFFLRLRRCSWASPAGACGAGRFVFF